MKSKKRISLNAGNYFENGYHCAEAVVAAVLEGMGIDASEPVTHATAFGGGIGRTFQEVCGALSGCLIVIGHIHGRFGHRECHWGESGRPSRKTTDCHVDAGAGKCSTLHHFSDRLVALALPAGPAGRSLHRRGA